jgi:hypothetical protein
MDIGQISTVKTGGVTGSERAIGLCSAEAKNKNRRRCKSILLISDFEIPQI